MKDSEHPQKNPLVELSRDDSHDSTFFQASPARLPGGGPVQHDGGVQRSNNDDTPGISYDLFTSFFKGKFEGLEKRLRDALTQRNQDTVEVEFKLHVWVARTLESQLPPQPQPTQRRQES